MTTKILAATAAACLLIGSCGLGMAQSAAPAETSTSKSQELGATTTSPAADPRGRTIQENRDQPGTNFAAPAGTTGSTDRTEPTVRPSEGADK